MTDREKSRIAEEIIAQDLLDQLRVLRRRMESVPDNESWDDVRDMIARKMRVLDGLIKSLMEEKK
jgi:hypothetical protein